MAPRRPVAPGSAGTSAPAEPERQAGDSERPLPCPDCGGGPLAIQTSILSGGEQVAVCLDCRREFIARPRSRT